MYDAILCLNNIISSHFICHLNINITNVLIESLHQCPLCKGLIIMINAIRPLCIELLYKTQVLGSVNAGRKVSPAAVLSTKASTESLATI